MSVTEAVTLIAAVAAALVSIIGAAATFYTAQKTSSTHVLVNGLSGDLKAAARAQGVAEGIKMAQAAAPEQTPSGP